MNPLADRPSGTPGPFQALSLDLWFTTIYYEPGDERVWSECRHRELRSILTDPEGRAFPLTRVEEGVRKVRATLREQGVALDAVAPRTYLSYVAHELGSPVQPKEGQVNAYAEAGLVEAPPRANPQALRLLSRLAGRGIPVVAVSNSARPGEVWRRFLHDQHGLEFQFVVSSCDFGWSKPSPGLFRVATERLGIPPASLLHAGDRWELDVEGASSAGVAPALYRGLWERYPPSESHLPLTRHDGGRPGVLRLDSLEELEREELWERPPGSPSVPYSR